MYTLSNAYRHRTFQHGHVTCLQFDEHQITRFLVSVEAAGLPLTLALNKCDLVSDSEVQLRLQQCAAWGYDAVAVSCASGLGIHTLASRLFGKTSVVAGPSGAGKSSLINALCLGRHRPDVEQSRTAATPERTQSSTHSALTTDQQDFTYRMAGQAQTNGDEDQAHQRSCGVASTSYHAEPVQRISAADDNANSAASLADGAGMRCMHGMQSIPSFAMQQPVQQQIQQQVQLQGQAQQREPPDAQSSPGRSPGSNNASKTLGYLKVGDVSKIGRGKHTTRTVSFIELPCGGLLADTPGFNQPTLDRVPSSNLWTLFPEFVDAIESAGGCRFDDCMHLAEPGCAVNCAGFERYPYYVKFLAEVQVRM